MRPIVRVLKHAYVVLRCKDRFRNYPSSCSACEEEHTLLMNEFYREIEQARFYLLVTWHDNNYCGWSLTPKGLDIYNQLNGDFS